MLSLYHHRSVLTYLSSFKQNQTSLKVKPFLLIYVHFIHTYIVKLVKECWIFWQCYVNPFMLKMSVNFDETFAKTAKKVLSNIHFLAVPQRKDKMLHFIRGKFCKSTWYLYIRIYIFISISYQNTLNINDINVKKMCNFYWKTAGKEQNWCWQMVGVIFSFGFVNPLRWHPFYYFEFLYRVRVCIAVATQIIQSHIQCVTNFLQQATTAAATAVYVVIYLPAFFIVSTCKFRTF